MKSSTSFLLTTLALAVLLTCGDAGRTGGKQLSSYNSTVSKEADPGPGPGDDGPDGPGGNGGNNGDNGGDNSGNSGDNGGGSGDNGANGGNNGGNSGDNGGNSGNNGGNNGGNSGNNGGNSGGNSGNNGGNSGDNGSKSGGHSGDNGGNSGGSNGGNGKNNGGSSGGATGNGGNSGGNSGNNSGGDTGGSSNDLTLQAEILTDLHNALHTSAVGIEQLIPTLSAQALAAAQLEVVDALALVSSLQQLTGSTQDMQNLQSTLNSANRVLSSVLHLNQTQKEISTAVVTIQTLQGKVASELANSPPSFDQAHAPSSNY